MKRKNKSQARVLSFLLVLAMLIGSMGITGWGTETAYAEENQITVYMTVSNQGTLPLADGKIVGQVPVTVDASSPKVNDALIALHQQYYGSEDGYASQDNESYTIVTKLWGIETTALGFYKNDEYISGKLTEEPVQNGDFITAFIYSDQSGCSDQYAFFEQSQATISDGDSTNLILKAKSWDSVTQSLTDNPVADSSVYTIDADTGVIKNMIGTTSSSGQVQFTPNAEGIYYISASCVDRIITVPLCKITVQPESSSTDSVTVRIEGNGIGTDGANGMKGTVLDYTVVPLTDLQDNPHAIDAVNKALQDAKLTIAEKDSYYTTFGGIGVPENHYWRFSMNDEAASKGLDDQIIKNKDRIVLDIVGYDDSPSYSYFKVISCSGGVEYGYPKAAVKLGLYKVINSYDSSWNLTTTVEPVSNAAITGTESWSDVITNENGIAEFTLWGLTTNAAVSCFEVSSDYSGISRPYCNFVLDYDGTNSPTITASQPSTSNTSLKTLDLSFPGVTEKVSGLNYLDDTALTVGNNVTSVSVSAIAEETAANVTAKYKPSNGSYGDSISFDPSGTKQEFDLAAGENVFKITVINGLDQEIYTLSIKRSEPATDTTGTDVANIISGIRDVNDTHASSYYSNDWVLGMAAAGLDLTDEEEDLYLANVLNLAADSGTSAAAKAKTAIALTSINIDATQVPDKNGGQAIDLIREVAEDTGYIDPAYTAPFILSLYDLENYEIPNEAVITRESLIENILGAQEAEGSWYASYGSDATGMVLPALALYYNATTETNGISVASCSAITAAVDKALTYLSNTQGIDGSFPGYGGTPSSNTMIANIVGINALGINPNTDSRFVKSGRSALQNLLSYQTSDNKLGYTDNSTSNDLACQQGLGALATYQNLSNSRSSNVYHFTEATKPCTEWPDADLLTSIKISTPPTKTDYSYDASETNYAVDTDGMVVTGMFNGDATKTTDIAISACTISTINRSSSGTQTVTVTYQGYTTNFMVTVLKKDGTAPEENAVLVKVKSNKKVITSDNSVEIENGKTTVMDVLKTVLDNSGVNYIIKGGDYVSEIDGLGEFNEGKNSGWLYSVNGETPPTTASSSYKLRDGDVVLWYYTLDYTKDSSSSKWKESQTEEAETAKGIVTIEVTSKVDASGKATAAVSAKDVTTAITDAEKSAKSAGKGTKAEVEIAVKGADKANSVEMTIPNTSIKELKAKVQAVTVKTPIAKIRLDADTIKTLSKESSGEVKINVTKLKASDLSDLTEEKKAEIGDKPVFDFSITSGNKTISQFDGKVTVSVPYTAANQEQADGLVVYYISDNGTLEMVRDCVYDPKTKKMTFTVNHFSRYTLGYKTLNFIDVSSHWAKDYITYLSARGVINGMSATTFDPNSSITRAQFVQILANLSGADLGSYSGEKQTAFQDVTASAWYAQAAAWAAENGIAAGTASQDGSINFYPNANITRQDMAVMISRYSEKINGGGLKAVNSSVKFVDGSQIADYAKEAVTQLQKAGVINGKSAVTFAPKDNATRAESAKMISVLMESTL